MKKTLLLILGAITLFSCSPKQIENTENGAIIRLSQPMPNGAKLVQISFETEKIVRVRATANMKFSKDSSLMAWDKPKVKVKVGFVQNGDTVTLTSSQVKVKVLTTTGKIGFFDANGNEMLTESENGKSFTPIEVEGKKFWSIRQVFESPANEAFFGLGQHQDGYMNYKGKDVDLFQYNTKVSVPFVISSRHYGILWDNYSQSKFGDSREYAQVSQFTLYNKDGKIGGLTATYKSATDTSKIFVSQEEKEINYEFLPDLKKVPAMFPMGQGIVDWRGYIASDTTGEHKFRFYSAGYAKVWVDGKLVIDRWRQCWNASALYFTLKMEKGKKYPVKIEWNPDGGESYISLRALKPMAAGEQDKLSLYSEVAKQIDYYFIQGQTPDEIISGYRTLTGAAPIMPKWALGFWQSRERYKTQDELLEVIEQYRKRNIPFDNIVLDWNYWPVDQWGSHEFDTTRFPDAEGMIKKVHEQNAHLMISVWAKFYEGIENYKKLDEKGFLYKKNIEEGRKDWIYPGYHSTFYDAMNPQARKMFWDMMSVKLFAKGIDAWWMDASEPDIHSNLPPADRKAFMNPTALGPGAQYFNAFPLCNAKGIYEGQRSEKPDQRVFILTRSAYAGQQRYAAATWSGDIGSRWDELQRQIPAGLNFCISGIPYWTTDIGGFAVEKRFEHAQGALLEEWREMMARWVQYGAFCPLFRIHGQFPYREIYNIAPENHPAYKAMVATDILRYRLMPYIYTLASKVYFENYTIMRPMVMDFPTDTIVYTIANQFMFGPAFMVCPVTEYKARAREVYMPASTVWYDWFTGKQIKGGQTIKAPAPYENIPIFVKAGSIVPVGSPVQYAMQKDENPVTLLVYAGANGKFSLYNDEGINYNYEKGQFENIDITYSDKEATLTFAKRVGSYSGMPASRKFNVVLISENKPYNIGQKLINPIEVEYIGDELKISLK